ncbi:MAG TPA: helix-turn-helix domain-containing protein [Candidatus Paceibacterota bacterium]
MSEYISLQEAARLCSYSQEYLSLRARQGKLKALKLGRNWVCTKEGLEEYIARSSKPDFGHEKARFRVVDPPRNLPIYAPEAEMWEDDIPVDVERQQAFQRKFQFAFAVVLVTALSLASMIQGHQQVFTVTEKATEEFVSFVASLQNAAQETGFSAGKGVQVFLGAVSPPHENWSIPGIAKDYFVWLSEQVRKIVKGY